MKYDLDKRVIAGGIILGVSLAVAILTYSLWSYFRSFTIFGREVKTFYIGISLSFVGYTLSIKLFLDYIFRNTKIKTLIIILIISELAVMASVSGLIDEVFFDPTKLGINEYIGFLIMFIATILTYVRKRR